MKLVDRQILSVGQCILKLNNCYCSAYNMKEHDDAHIQNGQRKQVSSLCYSNYPKCVSTTYIWLSTKWDSSSISFNNNM